MKKIALSECNLDLLTLATSYVYFEILVLKSVVNKLNRKVCAGSCLILAAKLNDVKGACLTTLIEVSVIFFPRNGAHTKYKLCIIYYFAEK